jgi:hypothetical protein
VLTRILLTFHTFFKSVQSGGPALLPDLSSIIRELQERRLVCPRLPPAMQKLLAGASPGAAPNAPSAPSSNPQSSSAAVNKAPVPRLLIGAGRNFGNCIRMASAARDVILLTDDGRRNFCLAYHYVGCCNSNCGGKISHRALA